MSTSIRRPVFGSLSQRALDRAYDQTIWAPDAGDVHRRFTAVSADVAKRMPPVSERYGSGEHQIADIFAPPDATEAPVFVVIHGGGWRMAMREAHYGPAPAIVDAGGLCVVLGFDCLPTVGIPGMAAQIQEGIGWIMAHVARYGGSPGNVHLIGHSSGAHLAAVALTTTAVRGATLISGMYELHPVVLSWRGEYMQLSAAEVAALSPMRHLRSLTAAAVIAWGGRESPEFRRQATIFSEALRGMGRLAAAIRLPDRNHYDMFEQLYDPRTALMQAVLRSGGLAT